MDGTYPKAAQCPHNILVLSWQATQEELEPLPTILTAIREGTPVPVSVRLSSTTERRYRWVNRDTHGIKVDTWGQEELW